MSENNTVVIDNGSGMIKAGFSGDDWPKATFPTIIGMPRNRFTGAALEDVYVGDAAQAKRELLNLKWPMEDGLVTDWDAMEKVWYHVLMVELKAVPDQHGVVTTEPSVTSKKYREKMTEVMMESFNLQGYHVVTDAVMTMYASSKTDGLAVTAGHDSTYVLPVSCGFAMKPLARRFHTSGRHLTDFMKKLLNERGHNLTTYEDEQIAKAIKEKYCFIAEDFQEELEKSGDANMEKYELPDGKVIDFSSERFRCPEALFQPELLGKDDPGLHHFIYNTVMREGIDEKEKYFSNIVLAGGCTMFSGIKERLQKELNALAKPEIAVDVTAAEHRKFLPFLGASIYSSLPNFKNMWITRKDYQDEGPIVVHRKCH